MVWSGLVDAHIVIFDSLEPPAFQKYSICWVFWALCLCLCLCLCPCLCGQRIWAKGHCSQYTLTLEHWYFLRLCLHCICLPVSICHCHCHPWGSVDSVCHQLSENIWFDRLAVVLWWFIRLYRWSGFLARDGTGIEGTIRGPRGPKNTFTFACDQIVVGNDSDLSSIMCNLLFTLFLP